MRSLVRWYLCGGGRGEGRELACRACSVWFCVVRSVRLGLPCWRVCVVLWCVVVCCGVVWFVGEGGVIVESLARPVCASVHMFRQGHSKAHLVDTLSHLVSLIHLSNARLSSVTSTTTVKTDRNQLLLSALLGLVYNATRPCVVSPLFSSPYPREQTIEFPDDELVEPLEGLDIADDGIELPPPPAPEADAEQAPAKPNLLVRG